jgi:heat-inducible transcriptional repressor
MAELTDRQRRILAGLVAQYIEHGEPISSGWLADRGDLHLSSATVRNVLSHLEELGLLRQPHTSAGRVPTDAAYRLYVDGLLEGRKPRRPSAEIRARLRQAGTVSDLLENVSLELSRASHQVGFALTPGGAGTRLRHIDFVRLEGSRVLAIVVSTAGQITHKVVDMGEPCDNLILGQAANYINAEFAGLTLDEVRAAIETRMQQERMLYDALAARALRLAQDGLPTDAPETTLHVQGASFLIDELLGAPADREQTIETMRALIRMIEEKHRLVALLTRYLEAPGLTIVIGAEHGLPDLRPFSLVASTFGEGDRAGAVGVIGPTRMRYQRAISVVDALSSAVTHVLEGQHLEST